MARHYGVGLACYAIYGDSVGIDNMSFIGYTMGEAYAAS
jgi:hypothetical protein